jgi:hypothetical protein
MAIKQTPSQVPTQHGGPDSIGIGEWPVARVARVATTGVGDDGMVGHHSNDHVNVMNAHPHQEHSAGYHTDGEIGTHYATHGFIGVNIIHGKRDKAPEHHPPKGLAEHGAIQAGQRVF